MSSYEKSFDEKYCYPNSNVLKNKIGFKDLNKLCTFEGDYTQLRNAEIIVKPIKGNLDFAHLKKIHSHIFQDIFDWAGKVRTVNIAKGNMFCDCKFIDSYSEDIFKNLKKNDYLIGTDKKQFADKLATCIGDINALHPFREGNGRSTRSFIQYVANVAGYELNYNLTNRDAMMEASIESFTCNYEKFSKIFQQISTPISFRQQLEFIENISTKNSPILKTFINYNNNIIV